MLQVGWPIAGITVSYLCFSCAGTMMQAFNIMPIQIFQRGCFQIQSSFICSSLEESKKARLCKESEPCDAQPPSNPSSHKPFYSPTAFSFPFQPPSSTYNFKRRKSLSTLPLPMPPPRLRLPRPWVQPLTLIHMFPEIIQLRLIKLRR